MPDGDVGAVLLAAGRGRRMGSDLPKAFLPLGGKPLAQHALELFDACPAVGEIVVVIHPADRDMLQKRVLEAYEPAAQLKVVAGGEHRQDSAQAGVRAIRSPWVAVHDVVRPLASPELITRVMEAARVHRAAIPALPVYETIKSVDEDGFVVGEVGREALQLAQTPQCFEQILLDRSLDDAADQGRQFTDEAGVVLAMGGIRSCVVPGEATNIKVTTPRDLALAETLWEADAVA